jgi:hypothetical protein
MFKHFPTTILKYTSKNVQTLPWFLLLDTVWVTMSSSTLDLTLSEHIFCEMCLPVECCFHELGL